MKLLSYPLSHPIQVKLDWMELSCLCSQFLSYRFSELRNILENLDEFTTEDIGEEDARVEDELGKLIEQYEIRSTALGESYPFTLDSNQNYIELKQPTLDTLSADQYIYLYCLIFSHLTKSRLFENVVDISNAHRDLFQISSTIAAAGLVSGNSISFGFPRPDANAFYPALLRTVELIGEGQVKALEDVNKYLLTRKTKDAGIDIVAWSQDDTDPMPGSKTIYLAQVASGMNWRGKPVKGDIEALQLHWMSEPFARVNDAMFIPFDIENDNVDMRNSEASFLSFEFGFLMNRLRLPKYAKKGLDISINNPQVIIERTNEVSSISDYVQMIVDTLQQEAA